MIEYEENSAQFQCLPLVCRAILIMSIKPSFKTDTRDIAQSI